MVEKEEGQWCGKEEGSIWMGGGGGCIGLPSCSGKWWQANSEDSRTELCGTVAIITVIYSSDSKRRPREIAVHDLETWRLLPWLGSFSSIAELHIGVYFTAWAVVGSASSHLVRLDIKYSGL